MAASQPPAPHATGRTVPGGALGLMIRLMLRATGPSFLMALGAPAVLLLLAYAQRAASQQLDGSDGVRLAEFGPALLALCAGAFALGPEIRAGLLPSRADQVGRMLRPRLLCAVAAGFVFSFIIGFCSIITGMPPDQASFFAGLPELVFLFLLAATAALRCGSPWVGVFLAGGLWASSALLGPDVNPWLRLGGYSSSQLPGAGNGWLVSKALWCLMAAGIWRVLPRIAAEAPRPWAREARHFAQLRGTALAALVVGLYVISGATAAVLQAHAHRGRAGEDGLRGLRKRLDRYAAIRITGMFGPGLRALAQTPEQGRGSAMSNLEQQVLLEEVVRRWPRDPWADAAGFELARLRRAAGSNGSRMTGQLMADPRPASGDEFVRFAAKFPRSPLAPMALGEAVLTQQRNYSSGAANDAGRLLLQKYPTSPQVDSVMEFLYTGRRYSLPRGHRKLTANELISGALLAARYAEDPQRRGIWMARSAELLWLNGEISDAVTAATAARKGLTRSGGGRRPALGRPPGRPPGGPDPNALARAEEAVDEIMESIGEEHRHGGGPGSRPGWGQ